MNELPLHIATWLNLSHIDTEEYIQHKSIYTKLKVGKIKTLFGYAYKGGKAMREKEVIDCNRWNHGLF